MDPFRPAVRCLPLLLAIVAAGPLSLCAQDVAAGGAPAVIVLVRHAEKAEAAADDPPLTAEGNDRARLLASLVADLGLDRVLSTDYVRTRETAAPAATRAGLDLETYDPSRLEALADALRAAAGRRVLVVGHSNTTPELVGLLGGKPGPPIDEAAEYDRLYVLTIPASGPVTTLLLRFGRPFERR
ncbi:MAG: histidine phosphatase family protein [Gemmatimonadetes bacterium]|nr:histidine phosphatase family protein [Gemmatimonadota bacterium]